MTSIDSAVEHLGRGRLIVVIDESRPNAGSDEVRAMLSTSAELVTPAAVAFIVRHTSGFLRVGMTRARCAELRLPQMVTENESRYQGEYTVTVDAADGTSTGISARDRAHTIRVLADPATQPDDLNRPGHILPVRAAAGGVRERCGFVEATHHLAEQAGLQPITVLSELVSARLPHRLPEVGEVSAFSVDHDIPIVRLAAIAEHAAAQPDRTLRPPSTGNVTPVMYDDSSLAR